MAGYEHLGAAYRFRHFAPTGSLPDLLFATQVEGKLQAFAFRNDGLATAGGNHLDRDARLRAADNFQFSKRR